MFSIRIRTNQQSTNNLFYFLHILFLLHIYTAFFTIANSLNNNDNEAIIQLSVDSIHVVKSSDPRLSTIEENSNDDEEKELLIALLTSFDDDYKHVGQIPIEKSPDAKNVNGVSNINNCTSPSASTVSTTASASAAVSIRFIPPLLDFGEQAITVPRMQTVLIVNDDSQPLELQSLSGTTVQFYSSFFTQKTLSSNGGNTSINVYYLPRTLGATKSTFTIKTNRGTLHYYVNGIGTLSPFHLRPLIGATIPLNATFEYVIHFYNPYNYSIEINEIYTSDENLFVELLSYKQQRNKIVKTFEHREQWHLQPYQVKPISKINYFAYKSERLHGFYCVKTNSNDTIIVPVEISVTNHLNLYSNVDMLEFSPENFIRSTARSIAIPVYVINNGRSPATIMDVRVTTANTNYVTVHHEKVQVPSGIHHLTKIAELTIHPHLIPADVQRVRGSVQVYTLSSSSPAREELVLQIPFRATVLHGSLDYDKTASYFYIPSSSIDTSNGKQECRTIKLLNRFNTSMVIYNVTTDKSELLSQYVQLNTTAPYTYARPGQSVFPICVNVMKQSGSSVPFNILEASLTLHTNLSYFHLPIYLYNGLLSLHLVTDSTNGGIRRNESNPSEYYIASIPVNASRTVKFTISNANPIDITIEKISSTLPKTTILLAHMQAINGSDTDAVFRSSYHNGDVVQVAIPAHHQATFSLTINGTSDPSLYNEMISFKTSYQTLTMNVKYRIISGSMVLGNKAPLHIDVFPNRVGSTEIILQNGFDEPTDVTRIEFPTYGNCFSFIWNTTSPNKLIVAANRAHQIGKLQFDMLPLCNSILIPSESTCYCGLNNHPEFKRRWDQHVTALNTSELDDVLVTKFRHLWKEWTSLVRKQRIQTTIWLITDQGEVSWPISIGFVWPSVLEFMTSAVSRTPVVIDYLQTLLNTTKAHNIVIMNPSSSIVQYSVELISSYEHAKLRNKRNSVNNQQPFDLSSVSKRVELADGIYKFHLQPTEQLTFTALYRPKQSVKHETYFVVRNNLTVIESILLRGEGGSGSLTVGNRKAGSSDIPLVLEMNEKQYKLCSNYPATDSTRGNLVLLKIVTLRNTGNIRVVIDDVSFGHSKCSGQGFSVNVCSEIEIEPGERYDLQIRFQPDYTLTQIGETLTLNSNIGPMTFPLLVRIPQRVLATCYQTIPRPPWEIQIYRLCLCSIVIMLTYIASIAVYDARRLYNDYLARAELRSRLPLTNERVFNLNDLSAIAAQDEQRTRERIESRTSSSTVNNKKDISKDEHKTKESDTKVKRPNVITNGSKDNGESPSKHPRTPEGCNTSVRSTAASPRAMSQRQKRVAAENGSTKSFKQQQTETPVKPQTLKIAKYSAAEQSTAITPPSTTPPSTAPSTTLTDDENEPFVIARSKRVSAKTKEPTTNVTPVKSTPITNGVASLQPTPSPPPPSSSAAIAKSAARSDAPEQRQHQLDVSRSSDSINDQQWYMVSSSRSLRKTATTSTSRRETTDESQAPAKANKTTSNTSEHPVVPSMSSSRAHTSVANQATLPRRRRGRRPARPPSPTHLPFLTKRTSLQSSTPLRMHNRELAFRQLTEQLWAAGLPSATTACAMSVRSRCSSAPPSEWGGADDEMLKTEWNNSYDDEDVIDWDEPDKPDEDFGRYVPQTEQPIEEPNVLNEWVQSAATAASEIPSLMSITAPPPQIIPISVSQKITIPSSVINEDIEPLPFPQHGPGPIQRPNKLLCAPLQQPPPSYSNNSLHSPETPDVLDQINRLLDHQNNIVTAAATTPTATVPSISIANSPTVTINELAASTLPWNAFPLTEWPSKYDSSWPLTSIPNPTVPSTTQIQNPFPFMSTISESPRPAGREELSVWSSVLGTATPRMPSASTRTQRASTWNEVFSSAVPSATELAKPTNSSWLRFWPAPDPPTADGTAPIGHETETLSTFWPLGTLSSESVASVRAPTQPSPSTAWWPGSSSDENNNTSRPNQLNSDPTNNRDQSRWDFAR